MIRKWIRLYSGISIKQTPLVQKKFPHYRDVRFIEIFSKIVGPQSKAIRSSSYCPSYGGVRFIVCPLYRDSTVGTCLLCSQYMKSFAERQSLMITNR